MGTTTNYHWTLPTVHSDATSWGDELNTTIGAIDSVVSNIEHVELAAIQGQVSSNALTVSSKPSTNTPAYLWFMNGGAAAGQQTRWLIYESTEVETGGNAGSNLIIQNYNDAGITLGAVVEFVRSTGNASFMHAVNVQGAFAANSTATVSGTLGVSGLLTAGAGANITGQLAVNGSVLGTVHYFCWPAYSDFLMNYNASIKYLQWTANWYDSFAISGGLRSWVSNGVAGMTLDASGNLSVAANMGAASISTSGNISAGGNISASGSVAANGGVTANGTVTANSGIVAARASGGGNAQLALEDNTGAARGYCYWAAAPNAVSLLNLATNNSFQLDNAGNCLANPGAGANFAVTSGSGLKPGGGSWGSWSDIRIKTVRGDYTPGLDAVLKLRPVTYVYRGEYAQEGKQFVGLVADEAMKVFPEMVTMQRGTIDGREVDDLKVLDTTALIFALVNAVKELKAEIEALKAAK